MVKLIIIQQPLVKLEIEMAAGSLREEIFSDLQANFQYQNKELVLEEFQLVTQGATVTGQGVLDLALSETPYLNGALSINRLDYQVFSDWLPAVLPVSGKISAELNINGSLQQPEIKGEINSQNTIFSYQKTDISLDDVALSFGWQKGQSLVIDNLALVKDETVFDC